MNVKGKLNLVTVFCVFEGYTPDIKNKSLRIKLAFEAALFYDQQPNYQAAAIILPECLRENPEDYVGQIYLERVAK